MSWKIGCVVNTLDISTACEEDIKKLPMYEYELDGVYFDKNRIEFSYDAMEHMDFLWCEEIQEVLKNHKVNGDVVFMSAEGDNKGEIWGYSFTDGIVKEFEGKVKDFYRELFLE